MVAKLFAKLAVHAAFALPSLPVCDFLFNFMHAQRTAKSYRMPIAIVIPKNVATTPMPSRKMSHVPVQVVLDKTHDIVQR